ncbi:DUF5677 domain-containing protein [Dyella nitratireducens]|uniref:Uncharacterized protein n=1 Tax=Dyella nitratireducens TaxID=1849580 RepID=A0ABQ1FK24_9GAMM|nr:DUF5677 domain-containing protein [Dyella nitratireducens]GGA16411.1 hypothetical protein GCM10010981_00040 [Dyella nitratireducens]GLQ44936.1 hypothetical protein GCM10007902_47860 [Dyella nitratireducens]
MSKSKNQRGRKKQSRKSYANYNISGIEQHQRHGSKLIPPLNKLPNFHMSSWSDDHMPEMLWAVLLTGVMDRDDYLACFRRIAHLCIEWFKVDGEKRLTPNRSEAEYDEAPPNLPVVDHTMLAQIPLDRFNGFFDLIVEHPLAYAALRPLTLIDSLPGIDRWKQRLTVEADKDDWKTLGRALAGVLDHQSQASTDIRWFKVIIPAISGRLVFPPGSQGEIESLRLYPNHGDLRKVRPSIRAMEQAFRRDSPTHWVQSFWDEAFKKTQCIDPNDDGYTITPSKIDEDSLYRARQSLIMRCEANLNSNRIDARLDTAFGLVLYALAIAEEVRFSLLHFRITGRMALRSLVEAFVTLKYLFAKDDESLWKSYRVYGAGQAKLAFLKIQEAEGELPDFLDQDALYSIANEDAWQEFLNIDVGHWASSNLRKLATESGCKDIYDKYYDWSSGFVHGHWAAVRDTNFVTCHNPLHRLHRIPRLYARSLNSVDGDVVSLINEMLSSLDEKYPAEGSLDKVQLQVEGEGEAADL